MADKALQIKIDRINEKKALYTKRVNDARKKQRPDIEAIWLNEIKVLNEKYQRLMAEEAKKKENKPAPEPLTSAKKERKLRQITNQIQYIEKKIHIHTERGEGAAVKKQTILLEKLQQEKNKLEDDIKQLASPPPISTVSTPAIQPAPETRSISSNTQKKINAINSDITHADKMIKEYQKYNSPKAQQWIDSKNKLLAQRSQLTGGSGYIQESSQPNRQNIAAAHNTNKQVRVIDLEIAHTNKMIREYQKYNSPKASQWIQRKNELLARKRQLIHPSTQQSSGTGSVQSADVKKRLQIISLELAHTNKMVKEYQKYNSPKAHEWEDKRNALVAEKAQLEGGSQSRSTSHTNSSHTQATDRESIKAQISNLNQKAKNADTQMRVALKQGQHQQAHDLHRKRDDYNQQVKKLTAMLQGVSSGNASGGNSSSQQSHTTHSTNTSHSSNNQSSGSSSSSSSHSSGTADALEKSIAHKYLHTRNFTDEHAYMSLLDELVSQPKYKHLASAKETLYDVTHASKLPAKGSVINQPFLRDCFKIKISGARLENYTINDTIFDTDFPRAFNEKVDRINPLVGPAPKLKHYEYLAHRDAIQLIPSDRSITKYHSQFAGAQIRDIVIKNVKIHSKGPLQGLFASDGSFKNIHLENISIETNSAHQIAILGLLSGTLDLSGKGGKAMHVKLLPLRLGGGNNIYINSFSRSSSYQYGKVSSGNSNAVISDDRQNMKKRGTYYQNFDMDAFFAAMRRSDPNANIFTRIKEAAQSAGTVIKTI